MKRTLIIFVSVSALLLVTSTVSAQTRIAPQTIMPHGIVSIPEEVRKRVADALTETKQQREEVNERIEQKRMQLQELREEQGAKWKDQITIIDNERKRAILERLDARLYALNQKWTDHANFILERLVLILEKTKVKIDQNDETDASKVKEAILEAESTIAAAQSAVETQAGENYTFSFDNEESMRITVQTTLKEFRSDLGTMIEMVREARRAVQQVLIGISNIEK